MYDARQALLIKLYNSTSKHSNYQILPSRLRELVDPKAIVTSSRFERERWDYLVGLLDFSKATVVDIGGNTGYFTYEAIEAGASHVSYFEGNSIHAEFVKQSASIIGWDAHITVNNEYINIADGGLKERADIVLLLNVLHHIGDDYGDKTINRIQALESIKAALKKLSESAKHLVFQLGFNWKGDIKLPLFEHGEKAELIDFLRNSLQGYWEIVHIGVAERVTGNIIFKEASSINMTRDDALGEFLNRPLFIMKSCCHKTAE